MQISAVPREGFEDFGLKTRSGAIVSSVAAGRRGAEGAASSRATSSSSFNGKPVASTSELQNMVTATKPGTSAPVKVMRDKKERTLNVTVDELDLEAEQGGRQIAQPPSNEPAEQGGDSFGLTLGNLTPQTARRLQMPSGESGRGHHRCRPEWSVGRRASPG